MRAVRKRLARRRRRRAGAGDLEPVEIGEHDVEDDEIERPLLALREPGGTGEGLLDLETLVAEHGRDGIDDGGSSSTTSTRFDLRGPDASALRFGTASALHWRTVIVVDDR